MYFWADRLTAVARSDDDPKMVLGSARSGSLCVYASVWSANGHHAKSQQKIGKELKFVVTSFQENKYAEIMDFYLWMSDGWSITDWLGGYVVVSWTHSGSAVH